MFASLAFLLSLFTHERHDATSDRDADRETLDVAQRELETWLFDRDSR